MKNILKIPTLLLIVILSSSLSKAQDWQFVLDTMPEVKALTSVYFPTVEVGYAVGQSGTIVKTIDGGNTWTPQTSITNQALLSVKFVNVDTGWAVGDSGTIIKTIDGGASWINQNFGVDYYRSVCFIDSDTGYAAGYDVLIKTTDGGNNWVVIDINTEYSIISLFFKSADTGFVAIHDTLFTTTDYGNTWTKKYVNNTFTSFDFPNSNIGYALSYGCKLVKTIDGGNTWFNQTYVSDYSHIYFTDVDTGYIVGNNYTGDAAPEFMGSVIMKTVDGGNTWDSLNNIAKWRYLQSIFFTNSNTGIIVGGNNYGIILKTTGGTVDVNGRETANINGIKIYPNPAANEINIEAMQKLMTRKITCEIINAEGQMIKTIKLENQKTQIDICDINRGFYMVKVISDDSVIIEKLIKQ